MFYECPDIKKVAQMLWKDFTKNEWMNEENTLLKISNIPRFHLF